MKDREIIDLYFRRSEQAIEETSVKYGKYCRKIAWNILYSDEDAEECVNDTWLHTWNAIPPTRPVRFSSFLGKITRNLALNMYEKSRARKRGAGETAAALDELAGCISGQDDVEKQIDDKELAAAIDRFLGELGEQPRKIFVRRYWYMSSVKEIAAEYGMGESAVKMSLMRTREQFRRYLEKEGIYL